ncbi:MAG: DUF3788 family protein [Nibricoccus sp.]
METAPSMEQLHEKLGPVLPVWSYIVSALQNRYAPLETSWKPAKIGLGWLCRLIQKKRTLLYLIPDTNSLLVAVVLGERAAALALESGLPERIKTMIREARPYAEGRGIRFPVTKLSEVDAVLELVRLKTTPK